MALGYAIRMTFKRTCFILQLQVGDLVFVDNPVGTGFSYVDNLSALTSNNQQIGADLMAWARDFFTLHAEYKTRPFYIFCESYGGKCPPNLVGNCNR